MFIKKLILFTCFALVFSDCKNDKPVEEIPEVSPLTVDTLTGAPIRSENGWIDRACDLLTKDDLSKIFGETGLEALNQTPLPGKSYCLMEWNRADWIQREGNNTDPNATFKDPKKRLVLNLINHGTKVMAEQHFGLLNPEQHEEYDQLVVGLGDGAVWATGTNTLSVWKDHYLLHITLQHTDEPIDNLPKAQEVAKLLMTRL